MLAQKCGRDKHVSPFARNPVPPVMRKFLPPRNSATPIPSEAVPANDDEPSPWSSSEKEKGLATPGLQHATPPTLPWRRVSDDDGAGTSTPRPRRPPLPPPRKPGRTARDKLTHDELPMPLAAPRPATEMQVQARWANGKLCSKALSLARARGGSQRKKSMTGGEWVDVNKASCSTSCLIN